MRRIIQRVTALLVLLVAMTGTGLSATAETGMTTWSVSPASGGGKDGRAWIEREVEPGESLTEHLAVTNHSSHAATFALSAADGYFTSSGRFTMLPSNIPSTGAGTWIQIADAVEVGAGATVIVPLTIHVPVDATPGDTAAGVAASVLSVEADAGAATVGLESRVGFRVMLRVAGTLHPAAEIIAVRGEFDLPWNPFRPGSVALTYEVTNTGNTHLVVSDQVQAWGRFGELPGGGPTHRELLPGESYLVQRRLSAVWPLGVTRVEVFAEVALEPGSPPVDQLNRHIWLATPPWPQLLTFIGAGLLGGALIWRRGHQRERVARLIEDARQEGQRSVAGENGQPPE